MHYSQPSSEQCILYFAERNVFFFNLKLIVFSLLFLTEKLAYILGQIIELLKCNCKNVKNFQRKFSDNQKC